MGDQILELQIQKLGRAKANNILSTADQNGFSLGDGFGEILKEEPAETIPGYVWLYLNSNNNLAKGGFLNQIRTLFHIHRLNERDRDPQQDEELKHLPEFPRIPSAMGNPWHWIQYLLPDIKEIDDLRRAEQAHYVAYFRERLQNKPGLVDGASPFELGRETLTPNEAEALDLAAEALNYQDLLAFRLPKGGINLHRLLSRTQKIQSL